MSAQNTYKSAHELRRIVGSVAGAVLPDEIAQTLPIPKKSKSALVIQVLFYREGGPPGNRKVSLPHYAMYLDPVTGKVLRFWAIRPQEMGISEPLQAVPGAGIDPPNMTGMEFFHLRERLLDISAEVWEAYASGKTDFDESKGALIREYRSIFLRITKKEVAPFYVMSSPDFFEWLRVVSKIK
jgi:hypothetical protein